MMRRLANLRRNEDGLSVIENIAALFVFSLVSVAILPLMIGSMKGAATARAYTRGKSVAQASMERSRGLPYFISYSSQNSKVDVLDLYFPASSGAGYAAGKFTTTCTTGSANPACPTSIDTDFTLTFEAEFVRPVAPVLPATQETYAVVTPPTGASGYTWNVAGRDTPPSRLLKLTIKNSWTSGGSTRNATIVTLLGDRKFGGQKIRGTAKVDYSVGIFTGFFEPACGGGFTTIAMTGGTSESRIQSRLLSEADQYSQAGLLKLTQQVPLDDCLGSPSMDPPITGATTSLHAPSDQWPATGANAVFGTKFHPHDGNQTYQLYPNSTSNLGVRVAGELPEAQGSTSFAAGANGQLDMAMDTWLNVNNAVCPNTASPKRINRDYSVQVYRDFGRGTTATTRSVTGPLGVGGPAGRRVESTSSGEVGEVRLFPVCYIGSGEQAAFVIENFTASTSCNSTADAVTANASATYQGTLKFWMETDPNNNVAAGSYRTINLTATNTNGTGSGNATDPLANYALGGTNWGSMPTAVSPCNTTAATSGCRGWTGIPPNGFANPMMIEYTPDTGVKGHANDVYMFPVTHAHGGSPAVNHTHLGYLQSWSSLPSSALTATRSADGRVTTANLSGAIRILTEHDFSVAGLSAINLNLGKMSCESFDLR